ncbi:MAG TPA: SEC-C metal-binding domain-containing protein, partial [Piscinibacter sp.]|nr:SEC-C metal-binding domain-containing protein [Piscinibacter sp.]
DGWFDPLILEPDDFNPPRTDDPAASLNPVSQSLMPWVAGFQHALESFPDLLELPDPAVDIALARLYRHLPAQSDEEREVVATLDKEHPLPTLDDAIEDLIVVVADLDDLTRDLRYKVETVKREEPKVGRNDPCPCGSGKKFKQCHGKA